MTEIYIKIDSEYKRIDLFKDETISLTSSIQNINDLSKVFTDFTQSFTIPASKNNQIIFNYWNENAVNDGFDHRIRYDALIELNTIPFRRGKIQIEKANEKDNRLESFSITFYGSTKQLKDLFKEDELSILDYSSINHAYDFTNVIGRVNGSISSDVRYPIVNSKGRYEYLSGNTNDVTVGGMLTQSVVFSDLFPAIKVSKIIEFIENRYGINFGGFFLNTSYFTELFLYCKNSENNVNYTAPILIDWTSVSDTFPDLDLITDKYEPKWTLADNITPVVYQKTGITITPTNPVIQYRVSVRVYDNPLYLQGSVLTIFDNLIGTQTLFFVDWWANGAEVVNGKFTFEIESASPFTFTSQMDNIKLTGDFSIVGAEGRSGFGASQNTSPNINIQSYIPKIKIVDFFTGLIKLFNLTILPISENNFELQPLELFYGYGNYIDINSFVITDNTDIERPKLFKKLTFAHEKSENILNNAFRNLFNREYGDLNYEDQLSNESSSYEIKTPFEDVMWEKTTSYDFLTAQLIDKDLNAYKPKPILMYLNDATTLPTPIKFYNGTTYVNESTYLKFTNELIINNTIASLNWGEEQSVNYPAQLASDSLFSLWYRNYISQLYDLRTRLVRVKAIIPITILTDIKLNDKIIYKDKKYIINNFTTNLTTNEVSFELVTDFRAVAGQVGSRFAIQENYRLTAVSQDIEVGLLIGNSDYLTASYEGTPIFGSTVSSDINVNITIPTNITSDYLLTQLEVIYYKDSDTTTRYVNIIQEP
jgi:hypothetical protein